MSQTKEAPNLLAVIRTAADEINHARNPLKTGSSGGGASVYAATQIAKETTAAILGGNIATPPGFYSPFLTTSSFQIPNNRKEVYLWSAFFYDNDPKIAAGINFYTDFIFSGFELECESSYIKDYFEKLCKKLNFSKWLPIISFEYHLRGDAFPFVSVNCSHCDGSGVNQDTGDKCQHEGATWETLSLMDPNQVEVSPGFVTKEPSYYMIPNDEMIRIVQTQQPKEQYDSITDHFKELILRKQPIYLTPECITHFKRASSPWSPYGTSLVRSMFPVLALKDKLRQAQFIIAERLILPVRIVKVGNDARPANEEDIRNVQEQLAARALDPLLTLVTHHAFEYSWVAPEATLQNASDYDHIESDLLDGMMLSKDVIAGQGPAGGGFNTGLLSLDRRLERFRMEVAEWMEEKIFKEEAARNGFTVKNENGEEEIIYPTVKWNDLELRDQTSKLQTLQAMQAAGVISSETLIEALDLNYDQEVERLRFEQSSKFTEGGGMGGAMPLGGGFGGGFGGGMEDMGLGGGDLDLGGGVGDPGAAPVPGDIGGVPAEPAAPGGVPMPAAPVAKSKLENYKLASGIIFNLVQSVSNPPNPRKIINSAHKAFLESLEPVTGRGKLGILDKKFNEFNEKFKIPESGGPRITPLNKQGARILKSYNSARVITAAAKKKNEQEFPPQLFTKLEQQLYTIIMSLSIPIPLYAQVIAGPNQEYQLDAAFPGIRLGIEADSETYHSNADQVQKDKHRDSILAGEGWTILRFTDKELKQKPKEVGALILQVISQLMAYHGSF
ncbi:MAG TPA: DUF559 domain-containing protein [Desulfosporosinus sp.]|nr:DUF559 domain-containing protein [Desulfosporosinus sp.]